MRYYGWYSNKARGVRAKTGAAQAEDSAQGHEPDRAIPYPLDPKTKFLSLVPTPGEIAPQYQTTVISSDDVAATAALKGSHEQGAPACSS